MLNGLTEGRNIHFVLPNNEHRAAIVSRVWDKEYGMINAHVFVDIANDPAAFHYGKEVVCVSSIIYSEDKEPGSWHFIEPA